MFCNSTITDLFLFVFTQLILHYRITMLKTYSLTKNTLLVSSESNIENSSVVYVYGDEREYIESFEHKSDVNIDNILTFDNRVAYDTMIDQNDEKSLLVSFLFPKIHEGGHLDNLTTSVVFLVFKNKLIIFTKANSIINPNRN